MVQNIITIKNDTIPYLDEESIEAFENVKLVSAEGLDVKMNSLILCSMSNSLKMAFDKFEDDHIIVTEFSFEELKQVKKVCMTGSCDTISQSLLHSFGFKEVINDLDIKYESLEVNDVMTDADNELMDQKGYKYPLAYINDSFNTSEIEVKNEPLEIHDDEFIMSDNKIVDQNVSENSIAKVAPITAIVKLPSGAISKPVEYFCKYCGEIFNEREDYMKHLAEHTVGCLKSKEKLDQNPQKTTNVIVSQCKLCEKSFVDGACLKKHKQLVHFIYTSDTAVPIPGSNRVQQKKKPLKTYQCDSCSKVFIRSHGLKSHMKRFHKEAVESKEEICDQCAKVFKSLLTLRAHQKSCHNENCDPITCSACGKVFKNKEKFYFHEQTHLQKQCSVCGVMVTKKHIKYHMMQNHTKDKDKPYQCKICSKGFAAKQPFIDHQNIHTGEKPYKCKYCSAGFASGGTKAMHQKSHLGIKRKQKNK